MGTNACIQPSSASEQARRRARPMTICTERRDLAVASGTPSTPFGECDWKRLEAMLASKSRRASLLAGLPRGAGPLTAVLVPFALGADGLLPLGSASLRRELRLELLGSRERPIPLGLLVPRPAPLLLRGPQLRLSLLAHRPQPRQLLRALRVELRLAGLRVQQRHPEAHRRSGRHALAPAGPVGVGRRAGQQGPLADAHGAHAQVEALRGGGAQLELGRVARDAGLELLAPAGADVLHGSDPARLGRLAGARLQHPLQNAAVSTQVDVRALIILRHWDLWLMCVADILCLLRRGLRALVNGRVACRLRLR
mmetsp:Transcript_35012/g.108967  ORF Transcript_35012/g.108967 Transcript_35012/m.108967 type:complete len:311 (+) Transcript_35012:246-1178(+)